MTHLLSSNTKFHSYQVTHCLLFKIKMSHSHKIFFKQNYHTWVYFKNLELSVYDSRIDIVTNLYRTVADPGGHVKIGYKKDGCRRRPHRFHVSLPPLPGCWIRYCRTSGGYGTLATHHVGSTTGYLHHIQLPPETSLASHTSHFLASQSHVF